MQQNRIHTFTDVTKTAGLTDKTMKNKKWELPGLQLCTLNTEVSGSLTNLWYEYDHISKTFFASALFQSPGGVYISCKNLKYF